ncbi:MAG: thioesterase domain protein [Phycisphaerales bacterium]|nr:thioesterase domain protein [Phycisphaerales bacterium]
MKQKTIRPFVRPLTRLAAIAMPLVLAGGCISSMKSGDLAAIQPVSAETPRVGQVYLIRGLIGLFSVGIDKLGEQINSDGITAHVFQEVQDPGMAKAIIASYGPAAHREPLVLIGHSVGAEDVITIARTLQAQKIDVDLMICLDATNPDKVPANVKQCINYYQSSLMDYLPILRGLPLKTEADFRGDLQNLNVRHEHRELLEWDTNHFNIDKDEKIHADIRKRLEALCIARPQWLAAHASPTTTVSISK